MQSIPVLSEEHQKWIDRVIQKQATNKFRIIPRHHHHLPPHPTHPITTPLQITPFPSPTNHLHPTWHVHIHQLHHLVSASSPSPPPIASTSHYRRLNFPVTLMASLAATTAASSLGVSEMLGNPLNFSGASRTAPSASSPATFKTVALFSKKKAAPAKAKPAAVSPADEELAKWYGELFNSLLIIKALRLTKKRIFFSSFRVNEKTSSEVVNVSQFYICCWYIF